MISYSQNFEDVILDRVFKGKRQGFYIDVGANHPSDLSVTKHFYDIGWNGINVEPLPANYKLLKSDRKRDVSLNVALSDRKGRRKFYQVEDSGHSCFDLATAKRVAAELGVSYKPITVKVKTLAEICENHCGDDEIDFLKVDVEGAEMKVLRGEILRSSAPK